MIRLRKSLSMGAAALALALMAAYAAAPSFLSAADHLDAPLVAMDGRTDINDVYVFSSPSDPSRSVLIMTVNPAAGVLSDTTFSDKANYEFLVDRNGDAEADTTYTLKFGKPRSGTQKIKLDTKGDGPKLKAKGSTGEVIDVEGVGALTAGLFDDPFFFDLAGFRNGLAFTGDDFFAGLNVTAIVLEVPGSALGKPGDAVGVWARTEVGDRQIDRMGRPAINTVLIPSNLKDAFNAGVPSDDPADFRSVVVASIGSLSGDSAFAEALADVLLPDVNSYEVANVTGFLNGRRPADDVIDAELDLLTKGAVTGDGVGANDQPFLNVFPYLAPAH